MNAGPLRETVTLFKLSALVRFNINKSKKSWASRATRISQLWSKVHTALGSNEPNALHNLYCDYPSAQDLANSINNHFPSVFELCDRLNSNNFFSQLHDGWSIHFTEEQILSEILRYPNNKACGFDGVPHCLYKAISDNFASAVRSTTCLCSLVFSQLAGSMPK